MLSARPFGISNEVDSGAFNYAQARTPGKSLAKTPGRALSKNRGALQENAAGSMTVNRKGKAVVHTPFHPATIQARKVAQTTIKPNVVVSRPLGDKTPFPNRHHNVPPLHTPASQTAKIAHLTLLDAAPALDQTPGALLRPSSTRKSLRAPRTSGSGGEAFVFKTPVTKGNHWDVSDGEIDADVNSGEVDAGAMVVDDYDEIEYMPPKVPEQPYEPPFDMPDYKALGRSILAFAHSYQDDDLAQRRYSLDIEEEINVHELLRSTGALEWEHPELPELDDDDPFRPKGIAALSNNARAALSKPVSTPKPAAPAPQFTRTKQVTAGSSTRVPARSAVIPSKLVVQRPTTTTNTTTTHSRSASGAVPAIKRPMTSIGIRPPASSASALRKPSSAKPGVYAATTASTTTVSKPSTAAGAKFVPSRVVSGLSSKPSTSSVRPGLIRTRSVTTSRIVASSTTTKAKSTLVDKEADLLLAFNSGRDLDDTEDDFRFDV